MRPLFLKCLCLGVLLFHPALLVRADRVVETEKPVPPTPSISMLQKAGYAFGGTVTAVKYIKPANRDSVGVMRISFHVDSAARGVRDGQILTISEWSGLWQMGEQYRPGERVFLFLYPPSKVGLTSPVQGTLGRLSVSKGGGLTARPDQQNVLPRAVMKKFERGGDIHVKEFTRWLRDAEEGQE